MKMGTIQKLRRKAKETGATVEKENIGSVTVVRVMAQVGHHWTVGTHELIDETYRPWKPDYDDLLSRMSHGVEKCTADTCPSWYEDFGCEWWEDDDELMTSHECSCER